MKRASYIVLICAAMSFPLRSKEKTDQFSIVVEPKWEDLEKNNTRKAFDDKWILAGDITFKKKAPEYITLKELHIVWKGEKVNNLLASLYEKDSYGEFMPIEKYLICDSVWKKSEQKLILRFQKPKTLYTVNTLSLVLTIPKNLEEKIKKGHFDIETSTLPMQYKEHLEEKDLRLTLGAFHAKKKEIANLSATH